MNKDSSVRKRSLFTTITATVIGLVILAISLLVLPIHNISELFTFAGGLLLVIICGLIAFEGKKGTIKDLIYSLSFWS